MAGQGRCSAILALAIVVTSMAVVVQGRGSRRGWLSGVGQSPFNGATPNYLSDWAGNQTFNSGDNLIFTYYKIAHSVLQVSEGDYTACNLANPIQKDTTGNYTVRLVGGTTYYICGTQGHCLAGQKVTIITRVPSGTPPAPYAAASGHIAVSLPVIAAVTVALVATIALW